MNEARRNWIDDVLKYAEKQLERLPKDVQDAVLRSGTRATVGPKDDYDPIAEKLGAKPGTNNTPPEGVRAGKRIPNVGADGFVGMNTIEGRNVEAGRNLPEARYPNYDYLHSDDPEVISFMHYLGLDELTTYEAVITIRQGEPVEVVATSYVLASKEPIIGAMIGPEPYLNEE